MSDAPSNASQAAALDAVLDELLQQVNTTTPTSPDLTNGQDQEKPTDTLDDQSSPPPETETETEAVPAPETSEAADAMDAFIDSEVARLSTPLSTDPITPAEPEQHAATATNDDALADSLDDLLKEASALQQTVNAVTQPQQPVTGNFNDSEEPQFDAAIEAEASDLAHQEPESKPAPPPNPAASPADSQSTPSGEAIPEPVQAAAEDAEATLNSLDEQLAALTDDLLAGEIEAPTPAPTPTTPAPDTTTQADAADAPALHAAHTAISAPHAHTGNTHASNLGVNTQTLPAIAKPSVLKRSMSVAATKLRPVCVSIARAASALLLTLLGLLSAPVRNKRTVQQSIGWLALYTLFLAAGVWIYLLIFRGPEIPVSHSPAPSILGHHTPDDTHAPDDAESKHTDTTYIHTPMLNRPTYAKSAASQKDAAGGKSDGHGAKDAKGGKEKAKGGGGH